MLPRIIKSSRAWHRCFCDKPPVVAKDPVYQAFLDKVREFRLKSPSGKPFEPNPEYDEELKEAIEKLALRYGGGEGVDMLAFPKFRLPDLAIDPISIYDLPEYEGKDITSDEKVEKVADKETKSEGGGVILKDNKKEKDKKAKDDKKEGKGKKEEKEKKAKDDKKEGKGKKEEKDKKAKDDKKAKSKDEKDKRK